jgi:Asp-tRNA(Asn)/Glu-tRNA(Gln) amidotransferase A subunit family amidase
MNLPWTHAGLPTLTLPAGKNQQGLPLGLQLTAGWYADEHLLAWGKLLQDPTGQGITSRPIYKNMATGSFR